MLVIVNLSEHTRHGLAHALLRGVLIEKEGLNKFNRVISISNKNLEDRDQRKLALSKGDV